MISYDLMGKFMMDRGALKEKERMHEWVAGAAGRWLSKLLKLEKATASSYFFYSSQTRLHL